MENCTSHVRPDLVEAGYGSASNLAYNEHIKSLIAQGEKIYHFGFGQAPFPVLEIATEALKKYASENDYLAVNGIPKLREGICKFHQHFDGYEFDPENVIVGPGSKELILLLMTVFDGDILVNSPSWTTYRPQAQLARHRCHVINSKEEDDWRITPDGINEVCKIPDKSEYKLLIFTNPCNPTSSCYTPDQLRELVKVFREQKILVLSDEIYARLHYDGKHECLTKYYPEGAIVNTGFSKWASAGGWRIGYNIYPTELRPLLNTVRSAGSHSYSCAPAPMQFAFAEALQNMPACEEYIQHTTRIMKKVGSFCARELRTVGVKMVGPMAAYYAFLNFEILREALTSRGVHTGEGMCTAMLNEAKVAVLAGGPVHLRPLEELTARLCYVNFDGGPALAMSRKLGLEEDLDDSFVKEFCAPVYEGILALKNWVKGLLQSDQ